MQLKALVKNLASEYNISPQLVMQNYMLERFLERVSKSKYRENFIIKGGFLIASMIGIDFRTTMDMDVTLKGYPVNSEKVQEMIRDIISIPLPDNIDFHFKTLEEMCIEDEYTGFRLGLNACIDKMFIPIKIDITSGDKITPREIEFEYKLMFEKREISVLAYNLITILAEKLETIISRGDQNTRLRDFYDVYVLTELHHDAIDLELLKTALLATAEKRDSIAMIKNYKNIMNQIESSDIMKSLWQRYKSNNYYASDIEFKDTNHSIQTLLDNSL